MPDPVAREVAHEAVAVPPGEALDGVADLVQPYAGLHGPDPSPHRPAAVAAEAFDAGAARRDGEARAGVAEVAIQFERDVDVDEVARLHHRVVGYAVRAVGAYREIGRAH